MRTLPGTIVLKPLPGLPVIRDLIVDMTQFFKQYNSIKPYLVNDDAAAREGAPAVARRARRAERPVRVHPVRQLLDQLPELLVEPRQVRRPGRPAAGLPLHRRQPRPGHRRAPGQPRRPVPPVPLPHHHELRRCLPEGPEPDQGDRQDQGNDGAARRLSDAASRRRMTRHGRLLDERGSEQAAVALPPRPARERPVHRALLSRATKPRSTSAQAEGLQALDGPGRQRSAGPAAARASEPARPSWTGPRCAKCCSMMRAPARGRVRYLTHSDKRERPCMTPSDVKATLSFSDGSPSDGPADLQGQRSART